MKNIGKLAVLGAVLAASASFAYADTLTLGSYGATTVYNPGAITVNNSEMTYAASFLTGEVNCGGNVCLNPLGAFILQAPNTFATDLDPSNVWHTALGNSSWVGINGTAGPVNTSNPAFGYYAFQTTFSAAGGSYSGIFSLLADDSVAVYLNGTLVSLGSPIVGSGAFGGDTHCADTAPTCLTTDVVTFNNLVLGTSNTLTFVVQQAGTGPTGGTGDPSGLDFSANLALNSTPEPSSLMLLGTGLVGAAGMLFRRRITV